MDSVRDECASGMLGDNIMPQDRKFSFPDIQWLLAGISFDAMHIQVTLLLVGNRHNRLFDSAIFLFSPWILHTSAAVSLCTFVIHLSGSSAYNRLVNGWLGWHTFMYLYIVSV